MTETTSRTLPVDLTLPRPATAVLVPDADPEVAEALGDLESLLGWWIPEEGDDWAAPAAPLDGSAYQALRRILDQLVTAERTPVIMHTASGYDLPALREVWFAQADIELVVSAVAVLVRYAGGSGDGDDLVIDGLRSTAEDAGLTPSELVGPTSPIGRAVGLLAMTSDDDIALLGRAAVRNSLIVLDAAEEAAYRRFAKRLMDVLHLGDPVASVLYFYP